MEIGIIGLGIIGSACKFGFEKLGHKVSGHDIILNTKINDLLGCEVIYICVPTPSNEDGSCNTSIVEEVVLELNKLNYKGVVAIKSTVKPTTTLKLQNTTTLEICFVPEFLRERSALVDFIENHDLLAIGTKNKEVFNLIKECHGHYPQNISQLDPTEAEILKQSASQVNLESIFNIYWSINEL